MMTEIRKTLKTIFFFTMLTCVIRHHLKARKGAKAAMKPLAYTLAGLSIIAATYSETQAQTRADTVWGTGIFSTKNIENSNSVGNVSLYLTPENMAMHTPDTTYEFITANDGIAFFDNPGLPVYIDSTTGISDVLNKKTQVFPTFGSELNAFFPKIQEGTIEVYNLNGQLVQQQEFHSDHKYLQLQNLSTGMYVYNIQTTDGMQLSGKFMKQNTPLKGPSARPSNTSSTFKDTKMHEATYWAKWEHPDFFTDSTLITLEEGNNGFINFYMTPDHPYVIDNQDISGTIYDLNNNYATIAGASVEAYIPSLDSIITTTSNANGEFVINGIPLDTDILFSAGDIAGKYSIVDFEYTTIDEVNNPADSTNNNFGVLLGDIVSTTTDIHIRNQNSHGINQDTVKYYLNVLESQKPGFRSNFTQLANDENNVYTYVESSTPLDYSTGGISISNGTANTNPSEDPIITPLGNVLNPIWYANTTIPSPNDYVIFVHEIKRGLGYDGVAWTSVMETPVQVYTLEDKDIAREYSKPYWDGIYFDEKSYIDIDHTSEDFNSKTSSSKKQNSEAAGA